MFRFTIRDVLWLTVVVALLLVLWRDRVWLNSQQAALEAEQASLKAQRRILDARFLELVDATDKLNAVVAKQAKDSN